MSVKRMSAEKASSEVAEWDKDFPLEQSPPDIEPIQLQRPNETPNISQPNLSGINPPKKLSELDKILLGSHHPELAKQQEFTKALNDAKVPLFSYFLLFYLVSQ